MNHFGRQGRGVIFRGLFDYTTFAVFWLDGKYTVEQFQVRHELL